MIVKTQNAILANILKVQKGFKLQIRLEPSLSKKNKKGSSY